MSNIRLGILWDGKRVGCMIDSKVDNFDLYGKWIPEESDLVDDFLRALDEKGQLEVWIEGGENPLRATIEIEPVEQIEVRIRP